MPRNQRYLTAEALARLDEAHAVICTEWDLVRSQLSQTDRSILKQSIRLFNEHLDAINDVIRDAKKVALFRHDIRSDAELDRLAITADEKRTQGESTMDRIDEPTERAYPVNHRQFGDIPDLDAFFSEHLPEGKEEP